MHTSHSKRKSTAGNSNNGSVTLIDVAEWDALLAANKKHHGGVSKITPELSERIMHGHRAGYSTYSIAAALKKMGVSVCRDTVWRHVKQMERSE